MKALKKILAIALVICMLASTLALTSCGKDEDNGDKGNDNGGNTATNDNTYTITVVDGAKNPVEGVTVMVSPTYKTYKSNKDGKITFETDKTGLQAMITASPDGYEHSTSIVDFKSGSKELTLTVTKLADETVTYTVKIVDQNNDPVVGASVQLCYNGVCLTAVSTDANGEITNSLKAGYEVSVKVEVAPGSGYTLPAPDANGYHATIPDGETSITITVTKN